jgi:hypothetical protein
MLLWPEGFRFIVASTARRGAGGIIFSRGYDYDVIKPGAARFEPGLSHCHKNSERITWSTPWVSTCARNAFFHSFRCILCSHTDMLLFVMNHFRDVRQETKNWGGGHRLGGHGG